MAKSKICPLCGEEIAGFQHYSFATIGIDVEPENDQEICGMCFVRLDSIKKYGATEDQIKGLNADLQGKNDEQLIKNCSLVIQDSRLSPEEQIERERQKNEVIAQERLNFEKKIDALMVTSGFNFEGYKITEYLGFFTYETAIGMGFFKGIASNFSNFFGTESNSLRSKLSEARVIVLDGLKVDVVNIGANAIIGIDVDYTMFGDTIVGVIANGTAVKIEKTDL
ncbi:MAG: YbjQ family protein [Clostridiales Family XIII bacterium]|nr:YbjQ family protein [Clostridiales Family XIII bacterium]